MTLREVRQAAGLTMKQLLEGCPAREIDIPTLSKIERGIVLPPVALLQHIYARCGQEPPEDEIPRCKALANGFIPMETQREAHESVDKRKRRDEILSVWEGVMIPRDVKDRLRYSEMNSVRPRITEMRQDGLLEPVEKRLDGITGMMVAAYRLTEKGQAMKRRVMHGTDNTEGQALA